MLEKDLKIFFDFENIIGNKVDDDLFFLEDNLNYIKKLKNKINSINFSFVSFSEERFYYKKEEFLRSLNIFDKFFKLKPKDILNFNQGIFITSNFEEGEKIVVNNPYSFVLLIDKEENKNKNIFKRIIRLENFKDLEKKIKEIKILMEKRIERDDLFEELFPKSLKNIINKKVNYNFPNLEFKNIKFKNQLEDIMKDLNLNSNDILNLIQDLKIYCDYDDVIVEFNEKAIEYINQELNTSHTIEDITDLAMTSNNNFFASNEKRKNKFLEFLNKEDLYDKYVLLKEKNINAVKSLKNIVNNFFILTATIGKGHFSKENQIINFLEINLDNIIKTHSKGDVDYTFAVLIDDNISNIDKALENPYAFCFLMDKPYNRNYITNNEHSQNNLETRVIRIKDLNEIINYLPIIVAKITERHIKKKYLKKELFNLSKKNKNKYNIK